MAERHWFQSRTMEVCIICRQSIMLNHLNGRCHNHDSSVSSICEYPSAMQFNNYNNNNNKSDFSFKQFCTDFYHWIIMCNSLKFKSRFLLLCLLVINMTVVQSRPHLRHYNYRRLRDLLEDEEAVCKHPHMLKQFASENESCIKFSRQKRSIKSEMLLKEGQTSSLCNYRVCVDEDLTRRPIHIHKVFCVQEGCTCKSEGVYRCTQLYDNVEVWYDKKNETLKVEYGCVCAANAGTNGGEIKPTVTTN